MAAIGYSILYCGASNSRLSYGTMRSAQGIASVSDGIINSLSGWKTLECVDTSVQALLMQDVSYL